MILLPYQYFKVGAEYYIHVGNPSDKQRPPHHRPLQCLASLHYEPPRRLSSKPGSPKSPGGALASTPLSPAVDHCALGHPLDSHPPTTPPPLSLPPSLSCPDDSGPPPARLYRDSLYFFFFFSPTPHPPRLLLLAHLCFAVRACVRAGKTPLRGSRSVPRVRAGRVRGAGRVRAGAFPPSSSFPSPPKQQGSARQRARALSRLFLHPSLTQARPKSCSRQPLPTTTSRGRDSASGRPSHHRPHDGPQFASSTTTIRLDTHHHPTHPCSLIRLRPT